VRCGAVAKKKCDPEIGGTQRISTVNKLMR
jgi:hypothetical protein